MSENQNQIQIQFQKIFSLNLNNPLDFIVYSLTEKRKKLMEESEKYKKIIEDMVQERINLLREYGYEIENYKSNSVGLFYYHIGFEIDTNSNMFYDIPNEYHRYDVVEIQGYRFKINLSAEKWGTDRTKIKIDMFVHAVEFDSLF